jgi:hypothetical protein
MIVFPPSLLAVGGSREGIAPVHLLDVQDINGNNYFWSDRKGQFPSAMIAGVQTYLPWVLAAGPFSFNRSLATNLGSFKLQNISGNTMARDMETQLRASAIEGAAFVYRLWQGNAQASWITVMGSLTFDDGTDDTATFKTKPFSNPAEEDTPAEVYCETCQLNWGGPRCGSTESDECLYSFQSCQVVERIMVALNDYEKNYGETTANSPMTVINRSRRI